MLIIATTVLGLAVAYLCYKNHKLSRKYENCKADALTSVSALRTELNNNVTQIITLEDLAKAQNGRIFTLETKIKNQRKQIKSIEAQNLKYKYQLQFLSVKHPHIFNKSIA